MPSTFSGSQIDMVLSTHCNYLPWREEYAIKNVLPGLEELHTYSKWPRPSPPLQGTRIIVRKVSEATLSGHLKNPWCQGPISTLGHWEELSPVTSISCCWICFCLTSVWTRFRCEFQVMSRKTSLSFFFFLSNLRWCKQEAFPHAIEWYAPPNRYSGPNSELTNQNRKMCVYTIRFKAY